MNVLRPLIEPAAVTPFGPRADPAGVGAGIGLGEPERAEDPALGQRPQPALALRVGAEQVQRQRADGHVRLPRRGHRLVRQPDLLHRRHEADGGHPDAAPLLGDQHAEQAQPAHLAEQVGRAPRLLPGERRTRRDLLLREVAAEPGEVAFGFGEREVHRRDHIGPTGTKTGTVRPWRATAARTGSRSSPTSRTSACTASSGSPPRSASSGRFGFDEGAAGHITARDPELLDHFWVNPLGMNFTHDPGEGPAARERQRRGRRGRLARSTRRRS